MPSKGHRQIQMQVSFKLFQGKVGALYTPKCMCIALGGF